MAHRYNIPQSDVNHYTITNYIRSISINSAFRPTPRCIFDLPTLYQISISCDILSDPIRHRAIFLTSFYGFLCMSNIAPHSAKQFSVHRHFLRQNLIFADPGAHLVIKWTKTIQDHSAHHTIHFLQCMTLSYTQSGFLGNYFSLDHCHQMPPYLRITLPLFGK